MQLGISSWAAEQHHSTNERFPLRKFTMLFDVLQFDTFAPGESSDTDTNDS